jgi:hypothetical protein
MNNEQRVLDAIQTLVDMQQTASRDAIIEVSGLPATSVDGCLRRLRDIGRVTSPIRGVFLPVAIHREARPISHTLLPDGMSKLEVGDELLELTPRERQMLGCIIAPSSLQYSAISLAEEIREQQAFIRMSEREHAASELQMRKKKQSQQNETPQEKNARIVERANRLKRSNVKAYAKQLALEEGMSIRQIHRILKQSNVTPHVIPKR